MIALHHLGIEAPLFDDSFSVWKMDASLPVEKGKIDTITVYTIEGKYNAENAIAIEAVNQEFEAAMVAGSAARLTAIYTSAGQLLPPNSPIIEGHDKIRAYWESVLELGIASVDLETIELDELGDTATEIGLFIMKDTDGALVDTGKYLIIWKKEQGQWKYHRDIWSSSRDMG